jgi:hypothetical protein
VAKVADSTAMVSECCAACSRLSLFISRLYQLVENLPVDAKARTVKRVNDQNNNGIEIRAMAVIKPPRSSRPIIPAPPFISSNAPRASKSTASGPSPA